MFLVSIHLFWENFSNQVKTRKKNSSRIRLYRWNIYTGNRSNPTVHDLFGCTFSFATLPPPCLPMRAQPSQRNKFLLGYTPEYSGLRRIYEKEKEHLSFPSRDIGKTIASPLHIWLSIFPVESVFSAPRRQKYTAHYGTTG